MYIWLNIWLEIAQDNRFHFIVSLSQGSQTQIASGAKWGLTK